MKSLDECLMCGEISFIHKAGHDFEVLFGKFVIPSQYMRRPY